MHQAHHILSHGFVHLGYVLFSPHLRALCMDIMCLDVNTVLSDVVIDIFFLQKKVYPPCSLNQSPTEEEPKSHFTFLYNSFIGVCSTCEHSNFHSKLQNKVDIQLPKLLF